MDGRIGCRCPHKCFKIVNEVLEDCSHILANKIIATIRPKSNPDKINKRR